MKRFFLIVLSFLTFAMISECYAGTEAKNSAREALMKLDTVEYAWPINDTYTDVQPKKTGATIDSDFFGQFLNLIQQLGGGIERKTIEKDPITDKETVKWIPSNLSAKEFMFEIDKADFFARYRLVGPIQIVNRGFYTETALGNSIQRLQSLTIKHPVPQPFLVKGKFVMTDSKIEFPKDGDLMENVPLLTGEDTGKRGWFSSFTGALTGSTDTRWEDVFVYITMLAKKTNGSLKFVVNNGKYHQTVGWQRKLDSVNDVEAYSYITTSLSKGGILKEWYIASDGNPKFVVKFRKVVHHYTQGKPYYDTKLYFAKDRDLSGVE